MLVAMTSRLSSTCCAVTRGPKQYQEHQPVGGSDTSSIRARRDRARMMSKERVGEFVEQPAAIGAAPDHQLFELQVSPAGTASPSVSMTAVSRYARVEQARRSSRVGAPVLSRKRPLKRAHEVNAQRSSPGPAA